MPGRANLTDDQKQRVKRQIEFYFSDSNIPRDDFLLQQVNKHPDGYVDLSVICAFARMREILKLGEASPDDIPDETVKAVAEALEGSDVVAVNSTGFQIKRFHPMPSLKESQKIVDERSLYVRPFSMFATLDMIVNFFKDAGASFNAVRLRRHQASKQFKGSLFIELKSKEEAERVAGLALEFEGAPLRIEPKKKYLGRKMAERKRKKEAGLLPPDAKITLEVLENMDSEAELADFEPVNKKAREAGAPEHPDAPTSQQQHRQEQFRQDRQQQQQQRDQQQQQQPKQQAPAAAEGDGAADGDVAMQDAAPVPAAAAAAAAAADVVPEFTRGCILELVLKRQRAADSPAPHSLFGLIRESLGGVRYVEYTAPEQQQQQQQQGGEEEQGAEAADGEAAAAAAEGGEEEAAAAAAEGEQQQDGEQQQEGGEGADNAAPPAAAAEGGEEVLRYMVRFQTAEAAAAALASLADSEEAAAAAAEGGKLVAGLPAVLRAVEGEEEEAYHKRAAAKFAAARAKGDQGGRGGRGGRGGFGGRGGGRGGRGGGFRGGRGGRGGFRGGRGGRGRGGRGRH